MSTGNRLDLAAIEHFAEGVSPGTSGVWFDPHTMARTMLALVARVRESDWQHQARLRQFDAITLAVSLVIEDAAELSKKQIVKRLEDLYARASDPA